MFSFLAGVGGALALEEDEIPLDDWMMDEARRVHALSPFRDLDPWSLPVTRGALAREVVGASLRLVEDAERGAVLRRALDELEEELAPEIVSLAGGGGGGAAWTGRGTLRLEARDRERGAVRSIFLGDLAVRFNQRWSWHQRIEIDGRGGGDLDFIGKEWKEGITGSFTHAYTALTFDRVRVTAGRKPVAWGTGLSGTLLLQGGAPPLDQVGLDVARGPFSGHAFVAALDDLPALGDAQPARRYLSGHRLSVRLGERVRLAVSETVVYGGAEKGLDWAYANPLLVYYAVDWNREGDDNVLWSADAYVRAHRCLDLFGEFLADDFQYDMETEPNQIGFLAGARVKDLPRLGGVFLDAEYVRVNNWVYGHEMPWNRYTHGRALLGHPIGPDADRLLLRLLARFGRSFDLVGEYEHGREGEGSVDDPRDAAVPPGTGFLTGDVRTTDLPAVEVRYHPSASRRFFARAERDENDAWVASAGVWIRFAGGE